MLRRAVSLRDDQWQALRDLARELRPQMPRYQGTADFSILLRAMVDRYLKELRQ